MTRTVNPLFNALGICALLSSLDKMGLNPSLIARQTAKVLGPVLAEFGKSTLGDKNMYASNMDEFMKGLKMAVKIGGLADPEALQVSQSEGSCTFKWSDCGLKDMSSAAKLFGYNKCPLCLPGVIVAGLIDVWHIIDFRYVTVDKNGDICSINLLK
jgi:hypothetical protein